MKKEDRSLIARKLILMIKIRKSKLKRKYFIILTGIPGSGKTTLSQNLEKKFNFVKVSTDNIKSYLIKKKYNFSIKDLFAIQKEMFRLLIMGDMNIVSDSNSDLAKYRTKLKRMAKEFGYIPIVIYIPSNLEKSYRRIMKRKRIKESLRIYKKIIKSQNMLQPPRNAYLFYGDLGKNRFVQEIDQLNLK